MCTSKMTTDSGIKQHQRIGTHERTYNHQESSTSKVTNMRHRAVSIQSLLAYRSVLEATTTKKQPRSLSLIREFKCNNHTKSDYIVVVSESLFDAAKVLKMRNRLWCFEFELRLDFVRSKIGSFGMVDKKLTLPANIIMLRQISGIPK